MEADLNHVHTFTQLVDAGSFVKAARRMNFPKSRVSRHLAALEMALGVQLVYRTTRRFSLTEAGRQLYESVRGPIRDVHQATQLIGAYRSEISGLVHLGASEDFGFLVLANLLDTFLETYPQVQLRLHFTNRMVNLVEENLDLSVRIGALPEENLKARRVGSLRFWLVGHPRLVDQCGDLTDPNAIRTMKFIGFEAGGKVGPVNLFKDDTRLTFQPRYDVVCNNFLAVKQLVLAGRGFGIIPEFIVRDEAHRGELVHLFRDWGPKPEPIHLVTPDQKEPSLTVKTLGDFLARKLRSQF